MRVAVVVVKRSAFVELDIYAVRLVFLLMAVVAVEGFAFVIVEMTKVLGLLLVDGLV